MDPLTFLLRSSLALLILGAGLVLLGTVLT
jgi:hypothetical protein